MPGLRQLPIIRLLQSQWDMKTIMHQRVLLSLQNHTRRQVFTPWLTGMNRHLRKEFHQRVMPTSMQNRNLKALVSKIILFYSIFYVVMKLIAILFQGAWPIPNLILAIPFVIFAAIGWRMLKQNSYSWIYVIAGIVIISVIRYYEMDWQVDLQQYFTGN